MEVHAELATATKMFDSVTNDPFGAVRPNEHVGPLTYGLPGTLPVANQRAIEMVVDLGFDLGCTMAEFTKWDRKAYFYPDLPKAYQISQYDLPLLVGGAVEFKDSEGTLKRIELTRIHLEEDTGKLVHPTSPSASQGQAVSLVDYNRAGVPLLELVTEPVLHSADDAKRFCQTFQFILQRRGISRADMEKGEMRCEANVSVRRTEDGGRKLGTKVEVKNLNSFRAVERAIAYEVERQIGVLESGGTVEQETRGWDDAQQQTYVQRRKETAADYRYFPDPDLPPVTPHALFDMAAKAREAKPYPHEEAAELRHDYGLSPAVAELLTSSIEAYGVWAELRGEAPEHSVGERAVLNQAATTYANIDVARKLNAPQLLELAELVIDGTISKSQIREVAAGVIESALEPKEFVARQGLAQTSDRGEIEALINQVLSQNQDAVAKLQAGDPAPFGFLVGRVMRAAGGTANPAVVNQLLREKLDK
ncbi:Asp-tRNA(Asn)/Glu-tRNA(Gln) amidotransferase subunit GatB [Candidatus Berkelbacteria bacterium]|nr:Asp-tRNA(Asn)/Glu-tRNA(Gln) amidotransferase subunit GatB [Candidatus Berkelbacteria bacterium]